MNGNFLVHKGAPTKVLTLYPPSRVRLPLVLIRNQGLQLLLLLLDLGSQLLLECDLLEEIIHAHVVDALHLLDALEVAPQGLELR